MLTIGAMLLLALVSLNFNSTVLNTSTSDMESKIYLTAFSISDNLIEEIKQKSFDQSTIDFPTTNTASLTPPASLGPEAGETSRQPALLPAARCADDPADPFAAVRTRLHHHRRASAPRGPAGPRGGQSDDAGGAPGAHRTRGSTATAASLNSPAGALPC